VPDFVRIWSTDAHTKHSSRPHFAFFHNSYYSTRTTSTLPKSHQRSAPASPARPRLRDLQGRVCSQVQHHTRSNAPNRYNNLHTRNGVGFWRKGCCVLLVIRKENMWNKVCCWTLQKNTYGRERGDWLESISKKSPPHHTYCTHTLHKPRSKQDANHRPQNIGFAGEVRSKIMANPRRAEA